MSVDDRKRERLCEDYDKAGYALCANHDFFEGILNRYTQKLNAMQDYVEAVLLLTDRVAPKPVKGRPSASKKLRERQAYIFAEAIIAQCRFYFVDKKRGIDDKLQYRNRSFEKRVFRLPLDIHSVSTMRWMASEYEKAVPAIIEKYDAAYAELDRESRRLPVSFPEYREKWPAYEEACVANPNDVRVLTAKTFKKLAKAYGLKIAARPR